MDNKGLNINRPLLSVRRFSSISSSPKNENRRNESPLPTRSSSIESCKTGSTSNRKKNSRSVPFGWEHSPGRPKNERNKLVQRAENPPSIPKLPPGRFFKPRKIVKSKCSKSAKKKSSGSWNDDHHVDTKEAHVDVPDTLSRGETLLHNCSASGVKGFGSDVKASGVLRAEPKTRDFMLGCFLPAARAKASDVPKRTLEKHAIKEKPQEVKKIVNMDNKHSKVPLRDGPNVLQDVSHDKEEEHDDYDSDYEYHEHGKKSSKFCGLIPRFCAVNPVHGMCVRAKMPVPPSSKTQASSSASCSIRETASEPARSGEYKHRSMSGVLKSESIETSNLEGSKLYNRLQGPWISVDLSGSIPSTVSERSDSSSKKKGLSFRELLADKNSTEITATGSQDSIIEKTLYVDTIHIVESPKENSIESIPSFTKLQCSFNESLESDMFADDPKHDMKARKCKDLDAELDLFDDVKGNQKLKAYETRLFQHPAPPPLPKSPSDSWLCRTLPSVSSKRVPALWIPKYPSAYIVAKDPKADENIRLQSPQEQMSPIPES